jgi:hypothetical protein
LVVAGDSVEITYEPEAEPVLPGMPEAVDQSLDAGAVPGETMPPVETALVAPTDTNPT